MNLQEWKEAIRNEAGLDEAKAKTYAMARMAILDELEKDGWKMSAKHLKVPHATSPDGIFRLWFKTQAVHYTKGKPHKLGRALSLWMDIRKIDPDVFVRWINRQLAAGKFLER